MKYMEAFFREPCHHACCAAWMERERERERKGKGQLWARAQSKCPSRLNNELHCTVRAEWKHR